MQKIDAADIRVGDVVEQRVDYRGCKTTRQGVVTKELQDNTVRVGETSRLIAFASDVEWFLVDRPKPPGPKLPEREGLVVASYLMGRVPHQIQHDNVLGRWVRIEHGWQFRPQGSLFSVVGAPRITKITEVTAVPDDALDILAELQRKMYARGADGITTHALEDFFRRVNEVQP